MKHFTIHQAKTQLSRLIQMALRGDKVIIGKGDQPLVELTVIHKVRRKRVVGDMKGKITLADDFNAPLDDMKDYQ